MKTVQVILMGWEYDRFIYGIKQKPANKVIFISSDSQKSHDKKWGEATTSIAEKIGESLKQIIDYEIILFDFHNLEECIEKTTTLLEKLTKEYDDITVNISSGTTILKMSMMLAAQYYPIKLFYVIPTQYTHPGEIITTGARALVDLPSINLSKIALPAKKQKELIMILDKNQKSFTQLTKEFAKNRNIKLNSDKMKQLKSGLFYNLKKLKEKNLIEMEVKQKELLISLTPTGSFLKTTLKNKHASEETQTKLKIKKIENEHPFN
ncbi:MAG TPA: DUF6293 family protein [archaeon]|nr:DUF6293 family protein [archaeon]